MHVNNVIRIKAALPDDLELRSNDLELRSNDFFLYWMEFLRPCHNISGKEMELAAAFLRERYVLSLSTTDARVVDTALMSTKTRNRVMESCGMKRTNFLVLMGKLKKKGFFKDGIIDPRFIPRVGDGPFRLLLEFDFG